MTLEKDKKALRNEKIEQAKRLLMDAGVDFKIGKASYTNVSNPALKEAASEFNDALLDEQAKKIKQLQDYIVSQNNIIAKQSAKISSLNGKITKKNKVISKKSRMVKDKDAVLGDVSEELRLSKIREKNLVELCQKHIKEIDELKDLVDDISLKYDGAKHNLHLRIEECENLKKKRDDFAEMLTEEKTCIDWARNAEAIKLYVSQASRERLWHSINQDICNEKELSFIVKHDGERVKYALHFDGNDIIYECSDPDKKPRPTEDNPEEIKIKDALKIIKKAMKEGHTVVIDYDDAADIINSHL